MASESPAEETDADDNHQETEDLPHGKGAENIHEMGVRLSEKFDTEPHNPIADQINREERTGGQGLPTNPP
jgi:hypothetical protein